MPPTIPRPQLAPKRSRAITEDNGSEKWQGQLSTARSVNGLTVVCPIHVVAKHDKREKRHVQETSHKRFYTAQVKAGSQYLHPFQTVHMH